MNWHYAVGETRYGPFSDEQFADLVKRGSITANTLVWQPGMTQWELYQAVAAQQATATASCQLCGQPFPESELVRFGTGAVCAACKPAYMQSLKEGAALHQKGVLGRWGSSLVMAKEAALPERCVRCNGPATHWVSRRLSWHPPGWYALILLNLLIYAVVAMAVSQRARIRIGLCELHRAQRVRALLVAWGLFGGAIATFFLAAVQESGPLVLVGVGLLLASPIYGSIRARLLYPHKMDKRLAWLKGAGPEFLASLPEWQPD